MNEILTFRFLYETADEWAGHPAPRFQEIKKSTNIAIHKSIKHTTMEATEKQSKQSNNKAYNNGSNKHFNQAIKQRFNQR